MPNQDVGYLPVQPQKLFADTRILLLTAWLIAIRLTFVMAIYRRSYPNLRMYLKKTETTQTAFAKRVGIRPSTLNKILKGTRGVSMEVAAKICEEANVPMESLVRGR